MKLNAPIGRRIVYCNRRAVTRPNYCGALAYARGSDEITVYPAKGQDATVQSKDEAECYNWSKQQTGYDPVEPTATAVAQKVEAPPAQPTGARARGAVRGAAAGAVVGEIADNDADEGAKTGAAVGVVAGGSRNRQAKRENEAQAMRPTSRPRPRPIRRTPRTPRAGELQEGHGACLEGKGYAVK